MSRLQCRGSIARAAIVVALLSSRAADAQVVFDAGPTQAHGYWWYVLNSGIQVELAHRAKAERRLEKLEAKLGQDAGRGDPDAVDCDARRIDNARYWIAVDEWLIRKHLLQDPGYFPIRPVDVPCTTYAAIGPPSIPPLPRRPAPPPPPPPPPRPMASAPKVSITIVNAEPSGDGVAFDIDGVAHQADAGSRQDLDVVPGSSITYDGGGSIGPRRYRTSPGLYEFRLTPEGWVLYKSPGIP